MSTAKPGEQSDLDVARDLMATCNELYRRTPAGLAPEIAFFSPHSAGDVVGERQAGDVGGSDFTVKPQVWRSPDLQPRLCSPRCAGMSFVLAGVMSLARCAQPGDTWMPPLLVFLSPSWWAPSCALHRA